jgi:hypothetical protein
VLCGSGERLCRVVQERDCVCDSESGSMEVSHKEGSKTSGSMKVRTFIE